jgi:hypothetical protein
MFKSYTARPTTIRAVRFTDESTASVLKFLQEASREKIVEGFELQDDFLEGKKCRIFTKDHAMTLKIGDWLIFAGDCDVYPCADGIFRRKYEEALP